MSDEHVVGRGGEVSYQSEKVTESGETDNESHGHNKIVFTTAEDVKLDTGESYIKLPLGTYMNLLSVDNEKVVVERIVGLSLSLYLYVFENYAGSAWLTCVAVARNCSCA